MTPFEVVTSRFQFPSYIVPHQLQLKVINDAANRQRSGEWLDMGTGKTFCSTAISLYWMLMAGAKTLVIMPPNLLRQWETWLRSINPPLRVVRYAGEPKYRKNLDIDCDFLLVGVNLFVKEYDRFIHHFLDKQVFTIVDEATIVAGIESQSHEKVHDFMAAMPATLLSGTPANKPGDAYGLMKMTAPGTYRNLKRFNDEHVAKADFYGRPIEWKNLDLLKANLMKNSYRVLFEDMYPLAEKPRYVTIEYDLDPKHYKLYTKLAEEQILTLPDGDKIDATSASRLMHALGQIIVNPGHFAGDSKMASETVHLIEEKLQELGDQKLVVFAHYKMSVNTITSALAKYGAVPYNGDVSEAQKHRHLQRFLTDPKCRLIVIQFVSGGKGLDGIQHVCNHAFFAEPCEQPRDFHQCVARLKRTGQKKQVLVMLGIAGDTMQGRRFRSLLKNDATINRVIRNSVDLRKEIYGQPD